MTKITIEIDGAVTQQSTTPQGTPSQPTPSQGTGAPTAAAEVSHGLEPPADVLAQAAAIGAINGGPAPSDAAIAASSAAPIASSIGGAGMHASGTSGAASGGAAPKHVFGGTN